MLGYGYKYQDFVEMPTHNLTWRYLVYIHELVARARHMHGP
jgi:hypothetical protein